MQMFPVPSISNGSLLSAIGSNLVEEEGREADAKLGGDDSEASLGPPVLPDREEKHRESSNLNPTSTC